METTIRAEHDAAMNYAQDAMAAKWRGDRELADRLNRLALPHEVAAADLAYERNAPDPTYGVLHRSAAWLAYNVGEIDQAIALASRGLERCSNERERRNLRVVRYVSQRVLRRLSEREAAHNAPESRQDGPGRAEGVMLAIRAPLPPTTNNLYTVAHNRLVLTSAGRTYKEHVGWLTREAMRVPGSWPIQPPYAVSVHFYLENRRRRDVDGSSKVLIDGIFAALGVDDSLISDLDLHKRLDRANPRADVVIRRAEA